MPHLLADVFYGRVWDDFTKDTYEKFLDVPNSYLLAMNVDWFQPYKRAVYLTGAIYLTLLPELRYRQENVMLVGVVPGPKEPKPNTLLL